MKKLPITLFIILLITVLLTACSDKETSEAVGNDDSSLPEKMTWSVYDVGASGYAEMSAIADMLTEEYNVNVRMLPSGDGVGRMTPLEADIASIAKLGEESQFAFEGIEEFSSKKWGPQNLRSVWAPISYYGFATRGDEDIESIEDLEGMKVPRFPGNSSVNVKTEAILAFGELTWDDVEIVEITSYADQADALIQGEIDVMSGIPASSAFVEVESKVGVNWLEMDPNDEKAWNRLEEIAPWMFSETRDEGAGIEDDTSLLGYGYLVVSYDDLDVDTVEEFVEVLDENFDMYKNAMPSLKQYATDKVLTEPEGVPFHEGTVEFFKKNDLWDDEKQKKNDELIDRFNKLESTWNETLKEAENQNIADDDFAEFWLKKREEIN